MTTKKFIIFINFYIKFLKLVFSLQIRLFYFYLLINENIFLFKFIKFFQRKDILLVSFQFYHLKKIFKFIKKICNFQN